MKRSEYFLTYAIAVLVAALPAYSIADTSASDLQSQIDQHNSQITQLNKEISQYQSQLSATTKQKTSLQNSLNQISLSLKKTAASIQVTTNRIATAQLQISQLGQQITSKQTVVSKEQAGMAESLRSMNQRESQPLAISILSADNLSEAWDDIAEQEAIQNAFGAQLGQLHVDVQALSAIKNKTEDTQNDLVTQQATLKEQQGSLNATQETQNDLLSQTKAKESTYQTLLAQKKKQQADLEAALVDLKSQYNQIVNQSEITPASPGVLAWPFSGKIIITQFFGNTPFANAHAPLYNGHGHDGIDISAPIGTPVLAALSGTILATGNTDAVKGCYSFGKWIMIKHNNGINTMYAHLSQIGVSAGQSVSTGDVIGYSGETGYATGPHLHFGVYVSAVTKIINLGSATQGTTPCSKAVMPVPPVSGYLNPLNYLPATGYTSLD